MKKRPSRHDAKSAYCEAEGIDSEKSTRNEATPFEILAAERRLGKSLL
jgi:hypothetical protein